MPPLGEDRDRALGSTHDLLRLQRLAGNVAVASSLPPSDLGVQRSVVAPFLATVSKSLEVLRERLVTMMAAPTGAVVDDAVALIMAAAPLLRRLLYQDEHVRNVVLDGFRGEDRERVISALLSGFPYVPGVESGIYHKMEPADRAALDEQVNTRFLLETGIPRRLNPGSPADMPLVRRWLELRDEGVTGSGPGGGDDRAKDYERYVHEAVELLAAARWGSATDLGTGTFDATNWERVLDVELTRQARRALGNNELRAGKLVSKAGISPSRALHELFTRLHEWKFDCVEFVQVAILYARWKTMGDEAFDASVGDRRLELRIQSSTGIEGAYMYRRDGPGDPMTFTTATGGQTVVEASVEELLDEAPVGARVVWRNRVLPNTHPFFNENTIKLGSDDYAAHGLDSDRNRYSRAELELKMAKASYDGPDELRTDSVYVRENVFVRTIEHYATP